MKTQYSVRFTLAAILLLNVAICLTSYTGKICMHVNAIHAARAGSDNNALTPAPNILLYQSQFNLKPIIN
jgi:hypothetical protein